MHAQGQVPKLLGVLCSTKVAVDQDGGSPWRMEPLGVHRWLRICGKYLDFLHVRTQRHSSADWHLRPRALGYD